MLINVFGNVFIIGFYIIRIGIEKIRGIDKLLLIIVPVNRSNNLILFNIFSDFGNQISCYLFLRSLIIDKKNSMIFIYNLH